MEVSTSEANGAGAEQSSSNAAAPEDPAKIQALRDEVAQLRASNSQLTDLIGQWHSQVVELQERAAQAARIQAPASGRWTQHYTMDGHAYWHNSQTGQSSWTKPPDAEKPKTTAKPEGPPGANLFVLRKKRKYERDDFFDDDLRAAFQPFGTLLRADMAFDPNDNGATKGFGFVSYDNAESATAAINALHGTTVAGYTMVIERTGEKTPKPAPGAGAAFTYAPGYQQ